MKQTLRYTAWCWRLCRRPLGMWLALGAAAQAVPLLWAASRPANAAYSYDWLQNSAGTPFVFAVFYLGAAVAAQWPVRQAAGRSRAAFTILTFRMPRRCLLAGHMLNTLLALFAAMAGELALLFALCPAALALQDAAAAASFAFALPAAGRLWWAWAGSYTVQLLLPVTVPVAAMWALVLAVPAVLAPAVALHRGAHRLAAAVLALAAAGCWVGLLYRNGEPLCSPLTLGLAAALAALLALTALSALWALRRAEIAR